MKPQQFWGTEKEVLVVDIDGTLCSEAYLPDWGTIPDYAKAEPFPLQIAHLNELKERFFIVLWTARYEADREVTEQWLKKHNVPYDRLVLGKKPYDMFIDTNSCKTPYQLVKQLEKSDEQGYTNRD